jgi:predicted helicase
MVARVDRALREELGVTDGLASEQVYILDPCCGTGGYLAAVLKRIDANLAEKGFGALKGQMVKKAATTRVFGFEILPAPFVVAHLKIGLVLQSLGATLQAGHDRVGVYSHPMWLEFIFGGMTQSMLRSSKIPVLVSH